MAIFNKNSNVINMIRQCTNNAVISTFSTADDTGETILYGTLRNWGNRCFRPVTLLDEFKKYNASSLTEKQTELFINAINYFERENTNT